MEGAIMKVNLLPAPTVQAMRDLRDAMIKDEKKSYKSEEIVEGVANYINKEVGIQLDLCIDVMLELMAEVTLAPAKPVTPVQPPAPPAK